MRYWQDLDTSVQLRRPNMSLETNIDAVYSLHRSFLRLRAKGVAYTAFAARSAQERGLQAGRFAESSDQQK